MATTTSLESRYRTWLWCEWNIVRTRSPEGQRRWYGAGIQRYRLVDAYRVDAPVWTPRVSVSSCSSVPVRCSAEVMDPNCDCGWYGFASFEDLCNTTRCLYGEAFGVFEVTSAARQPEKDGLRVASGWPTLVVVNLDKVECLNRADEKIVARATEQLRQDYGCKVLAATVGEFWEYYANLVHQVAPLYRSQRTY